MLTQLPNGCVSGILYPRGFYGRIGLATPAALERYELLPQVSRFAAAAVQNRLVGTTLVQKTAIMTFHGRRPEIVSVGLYQDDADRQDYELFQAARRQLSASEPGIHRRVILGLIGIKSSLKLSELPKEIYEAMLAEISQGDFQEIENLAAVDCSPKMFHQGIQKPDGFHMVFSEPLLAQSSRRSTIFING